MSRRGGAHAGAEEAAHGRGGAPRAEGLYIYIYIYIYIERERCIGAYV